MIQRYDTDGDFVEWPEGDWVKYEDHLAVVEQLEYELRYLQEENARLQEHIANLEYYVAEHAIMNEKEPVY